MAKYRKSQFRKSKSGPGKAYQNDARGGNPPIDGPSGTAASPADSSVRPPSSGQATPAGSPSSSPAAARVSPVSSVNADPPFFRPTWLQNRDQAGMDKQTPARPGATASRAEAGPLSPVPANRSQKRCKPRVRLPKPTASDSSGSPSPSKAQIGPAPPSGQRPDSSSEAVAWQSVKPAAEPVKAWKTPTADKKAVEPVQIRVDNAFPLEHFPALGSAGKKQGGKGGKGASFAAADETPNDPWSPADDAAFDVAYAEARLAEQIERETRLEQAAWARRCAAEKAAELAAAQAREARRLEALKVQKRLAKKKQNQFPLPIEVVIKILVQLDHVSRLQFGKTCRDVWNAIEATTSTWNMSTGSFNGAESGPMRRLPAAAQRPLTSHAMTIVTKDSHGPREGQMGFELCMLKRLSLACYNVADQLRHLEFDRTPLLTMEVLGLMVPEMSNLLYLGIFRCEMFDLLDTNGLLRIIRQGERAEPVQLDFYPSAVTTASKQVMMDVAVPALLYDILPQARAQGSELLAAETAFEQYLWECHGYVTPELLDKIEHGIIDDWVIGRIAARKHRHMVCEVDKRSNDYNRYQCRSGRHTLPGCFFPIAQIGRGREDPLCWGCRLAAEVWEVKRDQRTGYHDQVDLVSKWVDSCRDVSLLARKAMVDNEPPAASADKAFWQLGQERRDKEELQRHIEKGHLKPGQTLNDLKGRHRWPKIPKCS